MSEKADAKRLADIKRHIKEAPVKGCGIACGSPHGDDVLFLVRLFDALQGAGKKFLEHIMEDNEDETLHHPHYIVIEGAGPRFDGPTCCSEFLEFERALKLTKSN